MVTITEGNYWTVLHREDTGYGIAMCATMASRA